MVLARIVGGLPISGLRQHKYKGRAYGFCLYAVFNRFLAASGAEAASAALAGMEVVYNFPLGLDDWDDHELGHAL